MSQTMRKAFTDNFLGRSPDWYKLVIIGFLVINPFVVSLFGPFIAGWVLIGEQTICPAERKTERP